MLHQFCEQENILGFKFGPLNIPLLISVLFTSMALSSPLEKGTLFARRVVTLSKSKPP